MSTTAERKRKRRQRLRRQGIVDVSVTIPQQHAGLLRAFARDLRTGAPSSKVPGRLLGAISALKSIQSDLVSAGVQRAGVFGSTARGDHRPDSDIDIVIDIDTLRLGDILNYVEITDRIKTVIADRLSGVSVEVADRSTLKPRLRRAAERDAIYAY